LLGRFLRKRTGKRSWLVVEFEISGWAISDGPVPTLAAVEDFDVVEDFEYCMGATGKSIAIAGVRSFSVSAEMRRWRYPLM
jgi:hypothetical protein